MTGDEIAKLADTIYLDIKEQVDPGNHGKFLTIDVLSRDYEIGTDILDAVAKLNGRRDHVELFTHRIGYAAASRSGYRKTVK
jgi:hypothetical protein